MHSPSKNDKLLDEGKLIQEDQLETGSDGIPQEIWDDIKKNEKFIYYTLMFLNGSVLWAYYSCLSAQNYYAEKFDGSKYNFNFLTTLFTAWPMVAGHFIQIVTGLDKKLGQKPRVYTGYAIFIICASMIMILSSVEFEANGGVNGEIKNDVPKKNKYALLVLIMFGIIGFGNSLTEATYYALAALFPVEKFTNGVQIGNVCAGVLNITVATLLRLIVGGVKQTESANTLSFYLFFGFLICVLLVALVMYRKLTSLPCIVYLFERNDKATHEKELALNPVQNIRNLVRVFGIVWVPAIAQFFIFFVSLSVFPGFGCTGTRNVFPPYVEEAQMVTSSWYCAPGIIGSYNFGDFFGRIMCTAAVYKLFSMKLSFFLAVVRFGYIPVMLMGVAGTSLYIFGSHVEAALVWNILFNFTIGISNGLLSTVTMGVAPRLCKPEDRETAGAVMVFFLFLGIASGAHFGSLVSDNGWLGL